MSSDKTYRGIGAQMLMIKICDDFLMYQWHVAIHDKNIVCVPAWGGAGNGVTSASLLFLNNVLYLNVRVSVDNVLNDFFLKSYHERTRNIHAGKKLYRIENHFL